MSIEYAARDTTTAVPAWGALPVAASGLTPTSVKTGNYAAAPGEFVPADATSNDVPITLPNAPADGTRIAVKRIDASAHAVTVTRSGSDVFNRAGGSTTLTLSSQFASLVMQYSAGPAIWYVVSTDLGADPRLSDARTPTGAAGGDLTGTYPNPTLAGTANVEAIIRANRLDQFAAPTADVSMGTHKLTAVADGTASSDGAAFGQIAAAMAALLGGPSPAWPASTAVTAYKLYQLPTGGLGYVTAGRTTGATFDATERAAWIFIPGRHYEKVTSGTTWTGPAGITRARFRLRGGGAGGGGGGSAATGIAQIGGAGGGAGAALDFDAAVTATTVYTLAIGAGGAGGSAGAAGGNPGGNGGNGGDTTITIGATTYTARGGGRGLASGAGATTAVSGGHYGNAGGGSTVAAVPGQGGASAAIAIGFDNVSGGAGAGTCTTTLGGVGGNARTAPGAQAAAPSGNSGTSSGTAGTAATEPGCGGGGGGGGTNNTGAGAAGGAGVAGQIEIWF